MTIDNDVAFRRAACTDIDSLVTLRATFLAEVGSSDPANAELLDALADYFTETIPKGEHVGFLATAGDRIIATSGLVYHRSPPSAQNLKGLSAYIMNMYTLPAWRGRGIASRLLTELIAFARQADCSRVSLHALPQAISLYSRAQFVSVENEMRLELRQPD